MYYIKLVLVVLISLKLSVTSKKCVGTKLCYDENDVKRVLSNPFLEENNEDEIRNSMDNKNNKGIDSRDQKRTEDNNNNKSVCPNIDICQLLCLQTLINAGAQKPSVGKTGPPGRIGIPGPPGPIGPECDVTKGDPGLPGQDGIPGFPGERGSTGDKGDTGPKGEPAEGPIQINGPPGIPGKDGPRGEKGDSGLPGDAGRYLPGEPGYPGPPGSKGAKGEPGAFLVLLPSSHNLSEAQVQALSNYQDLTTILEQANKRSGAKDNPVKTCQDVQFDDKDLPPRSKYWIDPNGADISDAIEVICDIKTKETCIEPIEAKSKNITYETTEQKTSNKNVWLSTMDNGLIINYGEINHQIGYLHLMYNKAKQKVTIHCNNTIVYFDGDKKNYKRAVKLMSWHDVVLNAKSGPTDLRYNIIFDGCSNSTPNEWNVTILEYKTDKSHRLPIVDAAILDFGRNKSFAIEVGPVCFGNSVEDGSSLFNL